MCFNKKILKEKISRMAIYKMSSYKLLNWKKLRAVNSLDTNDLLQFGVMLDEIKNFRLIEQ